MLHPGIEQAACRDAGAEASRRLIRLIDSPEGCEGLTDCHAGLDSLGVGSYREMTEEFRVRSDHLESLHFCGRQY